MNKRVVSKSISAERLHFVAVKANTFRTKSNFALGIENCEEGIHIKMASLKDYNSVALV